VAKGYAEGPAAEEAERRLDELEAGEAGTAAASSRAAVFGSTPARPGSHFIGWLGEVDPDALFASGQAWGLTVRRVAEPE